MRTSADKVTTWSPGFLNPWGQVQIKVPIRFLHWYLQLFASVLHSSRSRKKKHWKSNEATIFKDLKVLQNEMYYALNGKPELSRKQIFSLNVCVNISNGLIKTHQCNASRPGLACIHMGRRTCSCRLGCDIWTHSRDLDQHIHSHPRSFLDKFNE